MRLKLFAISSLLLIGFSLSFARSIYNIHSETPFYDHVLVLNCPYILDTHKPCVDLDIDPTGIPDHQIKLKIEKLYSDLIEKNASSLEVLDLIDKICCSDSVCLGPCLGNITLFNPTKDFPKNFKLLRYLAPHIFQNLWPNETMFLETKQTFHISEYHYKLLTSQILNQTDALENLFRDNFEERYTNILHFPTPFYIKEKE